VKNGIDLTISSWTSGVLGGGGGGGGGAPPPQEKERDVPFTLDFSPPKESI